MKQSFIAKQNGYGVYGYIVLFMTLDNACCSLPAESAKLYAMR